MTPCSTGATGACCKLCAMGPCRLIGKHDRGVCGADRATVAARNFVRQVAAGTAAHSDHGRDVALALHAIASGEIDDAKISDPVKLAKVAGYMGIDVAGKDANELAVEVADCALAQFGQQKGELVFVARAPQKRQELWRKLDVVPRGIDREIVEAMHRTHAGTDQNYESLLDAAVKCALASGWGGSMIATDLQDIMYGTPQPVRRQANLGVLSEDKVNILIHGHEPLLASMIIDATREPEMIELAKTVGAKGINVAGICCTANESLMRKGVPPAGNMLHQELAILTGAVEAHGRRRAVHLPGTDRGRRALPHQARLLEPQGVRRRLRADHRRRAQPARRAPEPSCARRSRTTPTAKRSTSPTSPSRSSPASATSTSATCSAARCARRSTPLNENIVNGRIRGVAAVVGCSSPRARAGLRGGQRRTRAHRQQRAGRRHRLCRHHQRQARAAHSRDDGVRGRVASPRSARRSASRRCCTWAAAWTTRAS